MLYVRDVMASSKWYRTVLGADHDHDGPEFDRILDGKDVLLMLHARDSHGHGGVTTSGPMGGGVQLWFVVDDVAAAYERARAAGADELTEPAFNELAHWTEFTMRDPDGFSVAIAG